MSLEKMCPLCSYAADRADVRLVTRNRSAIAVISKHAVAPGQSLVFPVRHVNDIDELTESEILETFRLAAQISNLLVHLFKYDGTNIVCNNGKWAGQQIPHTHIHVIPRTRGDIPDPRLWLNTSLFNKLYQPPVSEIELVSQKLRSATKYPHSQRSDRRYFGTNVRVFKGVRVETSTIIGDNVVLGHPSSMELKKFARALSKGGCYDIDHFVSAQTLIGRNAIIRSGSVIYSGVRIGSGFDCGHNVIVRENSLLGNNVYVLPNSTIHANVRIGDNVRIYGFVCNGAVIEDRASVLGNLVHKYRGRQRGVVEPAPRIERGAVVALGATIVGGITIGRHAYIGANAVVTKDIAPNSMILSSKNYN
jgi:diadenosine tetraphosphate (Ap4A) HIT family hydrolase/acetyltransferase-like isoleucine patch superfamily enzyme